MVFLVSDCVCVSVYVYAFLGSFSVYMCVCVREWVLQLPFPLFYIPLLLFTTFPYTRDKHFPYDVTFLFVAFRSRLLVVDSV